MKIGQVSEPVKVGNKYYIFKLLKTEQDPRYAKHDVSYYRKTIKDRIRSKQATWIVAGLLKNLMADNGYDVEPAGYKYLLSRLDPVVFDKNLPNEEKALSIQRELLSTNLPPDKMNDQPLVVFKDGKVWSVRDFWDKLRVSPYPLNYTDPDSLGYGMLDVINQTVILNVIAKDAAEKGEANSRYVENQTQMWVNSLDAQALLEKFRGEMNVKENDLRAFYDSTKDRHLQPEIRKIVPLVVGNKKLAERLYRYILHGADIVALARKYSLTKFGVEDDKDPGVFITRGEWGTIGMAAFRLKVGGVSQVQKVADSTKSNYAIVKLIKIVEPRPYPYREIHQKLYAAYQDWILHRYVNNFLLKAVKDYRITVDQSLLSQVVYAGGNMLVLKTHFPLRTGAPGIQFFCPSTEFTHSSDWNGMNSPMLADWYNYAKATWFND